MKLATLKDGSRDGQLAVVARDLSSAHFASHIASTLQRVLDDWNFLSPQLEDLYAVLNGGKARHAFAFDPRQCMAPLPRAYQRLASDGSQLVQAASDELLGACDDVWLDTADAATSCAAALAVITGDVQQSADADGALDGVRLLMLVNTWGHGPRASACSPLAVTPDELGDAWRGGRVHLPLVAGCNGRAASQAQAAQDLQPPREHFGALIAQAVAQRRLHAGCIVGGTALVTLPGETGALHVGDSVRIEMLGRDGSSVFGALVQRIGQRVSAADTP
jgi:fumarylacetoacetate (FAA) hydrolase